MYLYIDDNILRYWSFLKWWVSPTTMEFPTKNDQHLGWRFGVPPFLETPIFITVISRILFHLHSEYSLYGSLGIIGALLEDVLFFKGAHETQSRALGRVP